MRRVRFILGALPAALWIAPLYAQAPTGTIRGQVIDQAGRQPLARATVTFGARATLTEADGRYFISGVPAGTDSLRARMIGYAPSAQAITVRAGQTLDVDFTLAPQAVGLSELVVVGYGEQSAGNITGAVTQVTSDEFNTGRVISPAQLIQSKAPGVQVVDNNEPGGGLSIRIRGTTSVNASNEPLYVIDGMPVGTGAGGGLSVGRDPLNSINPNDIQSITVLRDAAAASIYGSNAANGVVIITTRSGRQGLHIEYTGSLSSSSVARLPNMLTASQFRTAVQTYAAFNAGQLGNASTDWFSLVDRTAFGQEHNVVVSSASATNNWRFSLGYLNQDGILRGSTAERVTLGGTYEQHMFDDRLTLRMNLRGSRSHDLFTPGGVLYNAAQMGPTQPVYDPTTYTGYYNWPNNTLTSADNPVEVLNLATDEATTYRSTGNVRAEYRLPFFSGLRLNFNIGYDVTSGVRQQFRPDSIHDQTKNGTFGTQNRNNPSQLVSVFEGYLNYVAALPSVPGTVDLTGGYSYSTEHGEYPWFQATDLVTDKLGTGGFAIGPNTIVTNTLYVEDYRLISFFGRANYNLNDRYLAAFTLRRDRSSRFGPQRSWATFPSVALAWRISDESFLRGIRAISDLKLRFSWAKTGNQSIGNYLYAATYQPSTSTACPQMGTTFVCTLRPSAYDANLGWEETRSNNFGVDFGFHNQRLSGSVDVYSKSTTGLVFDVPVCGSCNLSNHVTTNIGDMKNNGLEIGLNYRLMEGRGRGLGWTVSLNAGHNTNKLTRINPYADTSLAAQRVLTGPVSGGVGTYIQVLQPGSPVNSFFTCRQFYQNGRPVENTYYTAVQNARGDSTVTGCLDRDRVPNHSPAPTWILGVSSYMTYGNWDLSFTLRSYRGNYVYNNVASNLGTYQELTRASPYNLHASVLTTGFQTPQYLSDYYVEDASFVRLDNLTIGYRTTIQGRSVRFFATGQNLFTITGYSGVDPTAGVNGIDNNIYPRSRTFSTGLTLQM